MIFDANQIDHLNAILFVDDFGVDTPLPLIAALHNVLRDKDFDCATVTATERDGGAEWSVVGVSGARLIVAGGVVANGGKDSADLTVSVRPVSDVESVTITEASAAEVGIRKWEGHMIWQFGLRGGGSVVLSTRRPAGNYLRARIELVVDRLMKEI